VLSLTVDRKCVYMYIRYIIINSFCKHHSSQADTLSNVEIEPLRFRFFGVGQASCLLSITLHYSILHCIALHCLIVPRNALYHQLYLTSLTQKMMIIVSSVHSISRFFIAFHLYFGYQSAVVIQTLNQICTKLPSNIDAFNSVVCKKAFNRRR
jgi:hypothetical protein